jgi:hypothetical protein
VLVPAQTTFAYATSVGDGVLMLASDKVRVLPAVLDKQMQDY